MTLTQPRRAAAAATLIVTSSLLGACGAPASSSGDSAAYPTKTIDVIVPYPAGGGSDIIARAIVDEINAEGDLGEQLQIVNKGGGAGLVGMTEMVNAEPDGYTISISPLGPVALHPGMAEVEYDPMTDIEFIAGLTKGGSLIAVPASSPYQTLEDLVEAAKAEPGQITFGGGPPAYDIPRALLEEETGATFSHVAYEGDAATTTAILGGNLDVTFTQAAAALPQVKAGTMRVLATVGSERSSFFPEVPTATESGIDVVWEAPYGVYAPAGVPDEVVETLAAAVDAAVGSDALQEKAEATGLSLIFRSGTEQKEVATEQLDTVVGLKDSGLL
jgi:tripartite-type tricarboxylate transporter receptor subunit TctC